MSFVFVRNLIYFNFTICFIIVTGQVAAHPNYTALVTTIPFDFIHGFIHPLSGIDHFLGILAIGLWATQNKQLACWILPAIFLFMMIIGSILTLYIQPVQWIRFAIAISIFVLGLGIAFTIKLPLFASTTIIALFGLFHGYSHSNMLSHDISFIKYGIGFIIATIILHLISISIGLLITKPIFKKFLCFIGVGIATVGAYLIAGV